MKRTIIAILCSLSMLGTALVSLPLLQWYKREFLEPNTEPIGIYMIITFFMIIQVVIVFIKWVEAIKGESIID